MAARKSPEELYEEREKRLRDCIDLKVPDRVPIVLTSNYFPARWVGGGMTVADSYHNHEAFRKATIKMITDLEPDIVAPQAGGSGASLSILGPKFFKWAGDGLDKNSLHQFIEAEPLKPEDYDVFLSDPGDWTLRSYLPKMWRALEPLAKLPPLQSVWGPSSMASRSAAFAAPDVRKAFEALAKAGEEEEKYFRTTAGLDEELARLGYPAMQHGMAAAPFDAVSDYLRGMAGTMLDMFRYPDKLLKACDLIMVRSLAQGAMTVNSKRGNPKRIGSALHRGSDGFMSLEHFKKFYWPTLKKLILSMIDLGLVYIPFYEGNWEQRLEILLELPRKRTIARFALTDMARAKAVLGGHSCIMGGVPHTLLQVASPSEVEEFVKNLVKTCGKDGGLVVSTSTGLTHEAKPENVKAMVEAVKKYGRY